MAARNEDWCLGLSARAVLLWVDHLIILDHASTDRTPGIAFDLAAEYPNRVTILNESDPQWNEMAHRQRMLDAARSLGASHIVYVDADEVLTGNLLGRIRSLAECTLPGQILQIPWLSMRASIYRYDTSGPWGTCDASVAFQDDPLWHWTARNGYDFHQRHPMGKPFVAFKPIRRTDGGLMHLQFVSERRLKAKQALYKMLEVTRWPGREPIDVIDKRYSLAVNGAPKQESVSGLVQHFGVARAAAIVRAAREANPDFEPGQVATELTTYAMTPAEWWAPYQEWAKHLHVDAEPWQEAQVRKLWAEHGAEKFQGLDLFGVCG